MIRYKLLGVGVRDQVVALDVLPNSPAWDDYLAWLAAGNAPDAQDPPPAATAPTAAETAARTELAARDALVAALKINPLVQALVTRTPADVDTWISINGVDLNSAKTVLRVLAYVVALLARERLQ